MNINNHSNYLKQLNKDLASISSENIRKQQSQKNMLTAIDSQMQKLNFNKID